MIIIESWTKKIVAEVGRKRKEKFSMLNYAHKMMHILIIPLFFLCNIFPRHACIQKQWIRKASKQGRKLASRWYMYFVPSTARVYTPIISAGSYWLPYLKINYKAENSLISMVGLTVHLHWPPLSLISESRTYKTNSL